MSNPSFTVQLAGIPVSIQPHGQKLQHFLHDYLSDAAPMASITICLADIDREREFSARLPDGGANQSWSENHMETLALLRKLAFIMPQYGALLFHGSAIAVDGQGYLFAAPSGTGKSTHAYFWRRLLRRRVVMVNDDKPFLKLENDRVLVCGSPWDGKHHLSNNISVPLKALCILRRGDSNKIRPISLAEAYPDLFMQTYHPEDPAAMERTLSLMEQIASKVSVYDLQCTSSLDAALVSFVGMGGSYDI